MHANNPPSNPLGLSTLIKDYWTFLAAIMLAGVTAIFEPLRPGCSVGFIGSVATVVLAILLILRFSPIHGALKFLGSLVVLAGSVGYGYVSCQAPAPDFEISALNTLDGDRNAYEITDMLIWNRSAPKQYGVEIAFPIEVVPTYLGNENVGSVVALVSGEGPMDPLEIELWPSFDKEAKTTRFSLTLLQLIDLTGVDLNNNPEGNVFDPGTVPFQEGKLTIQIARKADLTNPWTTTKIAIRNAPWEFQAVYVERERGDIDVAVKNLGGEGFFTVHYRLVRILEGVQPGDFNPMTNNVGEVQSWNSPDPLVLLAKDEILYDTVQFPDGLPPGRYLVEVYAVKRQNYARFLDPNSDWNRTSTLSTPWWFGRWPYKVFIFVVPE